ncbi:MAG: radical SAM family heme chaperone HemW [Thermacetogeniaceae bacterium]
MAGLAVYIHVPFCARKCRYCAFYSLPLEGRGDAAALIQRYLEALRMEIGMAAALAAERPVSTIYIGGGTPTVLSPSDLVFIIEVVAESFSCADDLEVTVEANPGTVSPGGLRELRKAGANRLSLGAQSFDPGELKVLGRIHSAEEIYSAFFSARDAGFDNIGLDLIYGIPGQSLDSWRANLEKAIELNPEHISVYGLSLEDGTPLADAVARGELSPCSEELQLAMWDTTGRLLKASGYERYEIANFARSGRECRHNLTYWLNQPYLGLGPAAHGYFGGVRYANHADLEEYIASSLAGKLPRAWEEHQTLERERSDTVIMGLRLARGISRSAFLQRFGCSFEDVFGRELALLKREGLIGEDDDHIFLTERGRLLANYVMAYFV